MQYIISIDPGKQNFCIAYFVLFEKNFTCYDIKKCNITNAKSIIKYIPNECECIIIENQIYKSKFNKYVWFLQGYSIGKNISFIKTHLSFKKNTYKERKKESIITFKKRDSVLFSSINDDKIDDYSDAFNLGYDIFTNSKYNYISVC